MSEAAIGAMVLYCGHAGGFVADIFRLGDWNVISANGPVTPANLIRTGFKPTHHLEDFPKAGYWKPERGVFVVPCGQVHDLTFHEEHRKPPCHHIWSQSKPAEISEHKDLKILYHVCPKCGKEKTTRRKLNQKAPK